MSVVSAIVALAVLAACGGGGTDPSTIVPAHIRIQGPNGTRTPSLFIGNELALTMTAVDSSGKSCPLNGRISYGTRDSSIVTVDESGVMLGMAAGQAWVIGSLLTFGDTLYDSVKVTVSVQP